MRFPVILFVFFSIIVQIQAQVNAPTLFCISADSLIFGVPTNNCGDFNQYEVYASQNRTGPYDLIGTITERVKGSFVHEGVSVGIWYYYMQSNFDCPGEAILTSDTLDNVVPDISPMKSVTVESDIVFLNWYPSLSPQTVGYVIYKLTDQGTLPYDTVFFNTSYVDIFALANEKSEVYTVVAMDACGNTSAFVESQRTIFLQASSSPCDRSITLNWNLFENWDGGIEAHEIWVKKDSLAAERVAVIEGNQTSYVFDNIEQGINYSFFVNAIEGGTGVSAKSNVIANTGDIIASVGDLLLKNVSFNDANEVEVTWEWDEDASLKNAELFSSFDNLSFESIGLPNIIPPLDNRVTFPIDATNPTNTKVFYRLTTVDNCDSNTVSNYVSTIFLSSAAQPNNENLLTWTPYDSKIGNVANYSIYKIDNGSPILVGQVDGAMTTFSDPIRTSADANACYYVEATLSILFAQSGIETITSRSNTSCLTPTSSIVMPNAFAPHGRNQVFKPTVLFGEAIQNYQLLIYNRYGGKVFESHDINIGWNGLNNGKNAPQGTYSYLVQIEQSNGERIEKAGILVLLR